MTEDYRTPDDVLRPLYARLATVLAAPVTYESVCAVLAQLTEVQTPLELMRAVLAPAEGWRQPMPWAKALETLEQCARQRAQWAAEAQAQAQREVAEDEQ